jgi:hypothetical protein
MFAIVYMRPDGWWDAEGRWDSVEAARKSGNAHAWNGRSWAIVTAESLEWDEDNDTFMLNGEISPEHVE